MRTIIPVVDRALDEAGLDLHQLDGVAVTHGPGLAGALLVGVNTAKGMALSHDLPFIGVNHLEGHVYAAWLEDGVDPGVSPGFPIMCLITSGGHTDLILMEGHGQYRLIGRTRDDAAGEAFDKAARVLGLGFPEVLRFSASLRPLWDLNPTCHVQGSETLSISVSAASRLPCCAARN